MEENGVWRTISGRRVFIADGQTLTEAMKNSGKFDESKKSESQTPRIVYGKSEGQKFNVLDSNDYPLTGEKEGQTLKVPENESNEMIAFKAPRTDGFVKGKYVADENMNMILKDGRVVLNDHAFNNSAFIQTKAMVEAEALRLSGFVKEGEFFRGTDNDKEIEYLKAGKIRPSKNHMTGKKEDGLSVWESPKYSFKYMYKVKGEIAGIGSDGEPLLKAKSVRLVEEKSYSNSDYKSALAKGKKMFCEKYKWSESQFDSAISGEFEKKRL